MLSAKPEIYIAVKFKNGTITDIAAVDELLSLENVGSKQVIRVHLMLGWLAAEGADHDDRELPEHFIGLTFRDPDDEGDPRVITYLVRGSSRDWVFVTASELDERIAKVKCLAPQTIVTAAPTHRFPYSTLLGAGFLLGLLLLALTVLAHHPSTADAMEAQWKAGTLTDPIQAIIIQQRASERERSLLGFRSFLAFIVGTPLARILAASLLFSLATILYPPYVFCWADQKPIYERRVRIRNYVLGAVLLNFVLSVIASIVANRLTSGR